MDEFCSVDINISGLRKSLVYNGEFPSSVSELKSWVLRKQFPQLRNSLVDEFYVVSQASIQHDEDFICEGQTYHLCPRLVGGKGGFGSMLRAIGAQIEKTTNREACRDLSGRRMRDINNEKQLKDWMSKQKERDKERARRREEKAARRKAEPMHKFEDKLYDQQREKVSQDLDDALKQGLKRAQATATTSSSATVTSSKKSKVEDSLHKQWNLIGVTEDDSLSSSNSDMSDNDSVTGGAEALPFIPSSDLGDSCDASTSAASEPEFCPPPPRPLLPIEHTAEHKADSDSQSSSLASSSSDKTEKMDTLPEPQSTTSSTVSEPLPSQKTDTEENTQDLAAVLENAKCAEDLECLGLEQLKTALIEKGLKCGGTLAERAHRLFAVQGLSPDQIDPSFFAKSSKGKGPKKNK